jgi:hypothetical protein
MKIYIKIVIIKYKNRFLLKLFFLDTPINSPFESILFIEKMKNILRDYRCTITPECNIKGNRILFFGNLKNEF